MGRKSLSPERERHELRRLLMGYYRQEKDRYQIDVRQKLRRYWRDIEPAYQLDTDQLRQVLPPYRLLRHHLASFGPAGYDGQSHYFDWLARHLLQGWLLSESGDERLPNAKIVIDLLSRPAVRRYLHELFEYVARLNLLWDGQVAGWACLFVHADVIRGIDEQPFDGGPLGESRFTHHLLTIIAVPGDGIVGLQKNYSFGDTRTGDPDAAAVTGTDPFDPYDYLPELEERAVQQVRKIFSELSASLEASHIERNPSGVSNAKMHVKILYKNLREGEELPPDIKKRIRRTTNKIEVSMLPTKGNKTHP